MQPQTVKSEKRPPLKLVKPEPDLLQRHERAQEVVSDWLFQLVGPEARVRLLRQHGLA